MLVNRRIMRIEWGDCDPAGIIYYPRYFAFFDACTSELVERALGMPRSEYLKAYDFADHALVNTKSRFFIPTRFGDDVTIESRMAAVRRSSFDITHRLLKHGVLAVEGCETRVWVRIDPESGCMKAVAVPPQVIERFTRA
jgi:4-hydroxybenzoyl-CoA thioesterase